LNFINSLFNNRDKPKTTQKMISIFLKAKHWQLFILMFGIPLIFQIILVTSIFTNILDGNTQDPLFVLDYLKFFPIIMFLYGGVLFGWFWSIAIGLQHKVPSNVKMKVTMFKIFIFIPVLYMLFILIFMSIALNGAIGHNELPDPAFIGSIVGVIIPLHLFSMFCIFHSIYFAAKTFKTVELQREVSFSDFVAEFFLIWFCPIGVWILQPQINKMIKE